MRKAYLAAASFAVLALLPSGAIFADAGASEQAFNTNPLVLKSGMVFADAGAAEQRINELRARNQELSETNASIIQAADDAGGDLSDDDVATIEANKAEMDKNDKQISARQAALRVGAGRRTEAEPQAGRQPAGTGARVLPNARDNTRHGFNSMGQFAMAVRNHYRCMAGSAEPDDLVTRLRAAATTYANEGTGADGGFLVPPSFSQEIWQKVNDQENLMNRCTPLKTDGNSLMIPKDETTPWQSSGGVQVYWEGEAQTAPQSKPVLEMGALRLNKLMAMVPISEEMLQDASGIESWLRAKAPSKMTAKINTAIIGGTGVGQPLGIIPSYAAVGASVVQQSKETSQAADTVQFANVNKMWSRMYAPWRRNAVWLINQDIEPQLDAMAFQPAGAASSLPTAASTPVYLPPGGIADAPYGRLKGRPVIPMEACAAIGDLGDIILVDLTQYWALQKAGATGIQTDASIHLYFDQAITAFRFIFRLAGQPAWSKTIARQNGSNTLSWAVALEAR